MSNLPCLLHGDTDCNVCYPKHKTARVQRPQALPRRTLAVAITLSLEERVNIKVLAPILAAEEQDKYRALIEEPFTEQELDYLIQNRME